MNALTDAIDDRKTVIRSGRMPRPTHNADSEVVANAHRRLYVCGSAERFFYMVEAAISKAWEAKHPSRDHADDELERLLRKRRGRLQPVAHAGGVDVFNDRDDGGTGQEDDEADA